MSQQVIDKSNADFWDTLCGWGLARSAGITGESEDDLRRFDELYFGFYPYLSQYVDREDLRGKKVLEIGLGFGTLGQLLASKGSEYHGVDIAAGPVAMMRRRLEALGLPDGHVQQAWSSSFRFPTACSTTSIRSAVCTTRAICRGAWRRFTAFSLQAAEPS